MGPSPRLSEALIHFFVLLAPHSADDRLRRAVNTATLIKLCSEDLAVQVHPLYRPYLRPYLRLL